VRRLAGPRSVTLGRRLALLTTLALLAVGAAGCDEGGGERSAGSTDGDGRSEAVAGGDATVAEAPDADPAATSLASLCGVPHDRLASLAEQASVFEEVHSVSESPAEILEIVGKRAAASTKHPDDCLALIKNHALARSGCHPGVKTYPWMGCDFGEERAPE
jgi:hypothetical protein